MPQKILSRFVFSDIVALYVASDTRPDHPGLIILPASKERSLLAPREHLASPAISALPPQWRPIRAWEVDSLVHVKITGDPEGAGFSQGRTMKAGPSTESLTLSDQYLVQTANGMCVRTVLKSPRGLVFLHELEHVRSKRVLSIRTNVSNPTGESIRIEFLTSFSLGGITPFCSEDAPNRLWLHRFRSFWSAEGRHECRSFEELGCERSWIGASATGERFGQVGSQPVRGWFPFIAVEDRTEGVVWAAQVGCGSSWQMELHRRHDRASISGGLADREFGHWLKLLEPGESFSAPEAWITTSANGLDDVHDRFLELQADAGDAGPASEIHTAPVVFNEWCTHWGQPSHEKIIALADRLEHSGVKYFVIDDGWATKEGVGNLQLNGDWQVDQKAFPYGLKTTCDALRARGFVPGIWFEFEAVRVGTRPWREDKEHLLHRDGLILEIGGKAFWDMRDSWVQDVFLEERVVRLIRECGIGYIKIDYNETLGLGVDGDISLGEGLRQHIAGVQDFFRRLRSEFPELVIESCSSGGHRLEPSFLSLSSLSSCTDAHETLDIPIIAANLTRLIPAKQSLIWAVLHASDPLQRIAYSLAAGFLGRLCLSGEVANLNPTQWQFVQEALQAYGEVQSVIVAGRWRRSQAIGSSWQHPSGAQLIIGATESTCLVVWHTFEKPPANHAIRLPSGKKWSVKKTIQAPGAECEPRILDELLTIDLPGAFAGGVVILKIA